MRNRWIVWGLPVLLLASVLVGLTILRPGAMADESPVAETEERDNQLPRFDCEESGSDPYDLDPEDRDRYLRWLETELDLDQDQVTRLSTVIDDATFRADEFWRSARQTYCELRDRFREDIRGVLTAEQSEELERLRAERRREQDRDVREGDEARSKDD